jgi:hypothetical protein
MSTFAVAVIPSNQDRNVGAIPGHNEAGNCRIIARKIVSEFSRRGIAVTYWEPILESADTADHHGLAQTMRDAAAWLTDQQTRTGAKVAALHVHTNAGTAPDVGSSHTGFCYGNDGRAAALGRTIAERIGQVLVLPVVPYDYSGLQYLFEVLFPGIPSVLLEVTRHDRLPDLQSLYAKVDAVAVAIVDGTLGWAGIAALTPREIALEAEVTRLKGLLGQIRALAGEA